MIQKILDRYFTKIHNCFYNSVIRKMPVFDECITWYSSTQPFLSLHSTLLPNRGWEERCVTKQKRLRGRLITWRIYSTNTLIASNPSEQNAVVLALWRGITRRKTLAAWNSTPCLAEPFFHLPDLSVFDKDFTLHEQSKIFVGHVRLVARI